MLDNFQILLWSATYICIIIFSILGYKKKELNIPISAVVLNFCWEIDALIESKGFWGHIVWLSLDTIIIVLSYRTLKTLKHKLYVSLIIGLLTGVFRIIFKFPHGMLNLCFVIDFLMALLFWIYRKEMGIKGQVVIAILKLSGDLCAWGYYFSYTNMVKILGFGVLVFNILYLKYALYRKWQGLV